MPVANTVYNLLLILAYLRKSSQIFHCHDSCPHEPSKQTFDS
jgi:hypothetical protein